MCDKYFVAGKLGKNEEVSVSCTLCRRSFHSRNRIICLDEEPIPEKGFLCKLCTQKQEKYPEVQEKINNRCKDYPTVFKYHTSNLTNY